MDEEIKVKGFNFFRTYFELIRYLPDKDRLKMYDSILDYVFEDVDPELSGLLKGIWMNISIPISNSKMKSKSGQTKIKTKSNENQKRNEIETNNIPLPLPNNKNSKFIKPTIEEIKNYCLERNNKVDVNRFYDFYESKGWKVGNQPMKDWKACIRTWEQRIKDNKKDASVPKWFDEETKLQIITEEEKRELDEMLKEFK